MKTYTIKTEQYTPNNPIYIGYIKEIKMKIKFTPGPRRIEAKRMDTDENDINDLNDLNHATDVTSEDFDKECLKFGFKDRWDAFRNESEWAAALKRSWEHYIDTLHAYYLKRDGPEGFLGQYEK